MQVKFHTTRNASSEFSSAECILKGLGDDGGLFVSDDIDNIHIDINSITGKTYPQIAKIILSALLQFSYILHRYLLMPE